VIRPALGYLAIPTDASSDGPGGTVQPATAVLSAFAAQHGGYVLTRVYTDLRGVTEAGLYRLMEAVRRGDTVTVVVPDLDHLRSARCLTGADLRTAERYLRARVLVLRPDPGHPVSGPHPHPPDRYARSAAHALAGARA
jgi:hypothetical protein